MKKAILLVVGVLLIGLNSFAGGDDESLKVTAFYPLNGGRGVSELCGKLLVEVKASHRVSIVVDPKYNPGYYTVQPNNDGRFCLILNSVTGRADVSLVEAGVVRQTLENVTANIKDSRFVRP